MPKDLSFDQVVRAGRVPWFKPWTSQTAGQAYRLIVAAGEGDARARNTLDKIKAWARQHELAAYAKRNFDIIARIVVKDMRGVQQPAATRKPSAGPPPPPQAANVLKRTVQNQKAVIERQKRELEAARQAVAKQGLNTRLVMRQREDELKEALAEQVQARRELEQQLAEEPQPVPTEGTETESVEATPAQAPTGDVEFAESALHEIPSGVPASAVPGDVEFSEG